MTLPAHLATWHVPAAVLGRAPNQRPAEAFARHGRGAHWTGTPQAPARLAITAGDWSWPIWDARTAQGLTIRVWPNPAVADQPARWTVPGGLPAVIPWHPTWRTASAEDRGVLIDDSAESPAKGWELLGLRQPWWFLEQLQLGVRTWGRYRPGDWIADMVHRRDGNEGFYLGRGCGAVPKRWGIVTATEVAQGRIAHPLAFAGLTQWGRGARHVAPATRVEWTASPPAKWLPEGDDDARVMPHGTRLAFDITDDDIARWVRQRGYKTPLAETATTFARALREWGCVLVETGTGDPQCETSGLRGPDAQLWAQLGVTASTAVTILDGLPFDRLYVVAS